MRARWDDGLVFSEGRFLGSDGHLGAYLAVFTVEARVL
jgi:hypothetical protein